jgi:hypothetical protein
MFLRVNGTAQSYGAVPSVLERRNLHEGEDPSSRDA